jgi:hypothetical protein
MGSVFILGHLGMGDMIMVNGMVRYFTSIYDNVTLVCKKNNESNVRQMFNDVLNLNILLVQNDESISPLFGCSHDKFNKIIKDYNKVYLLGLHNNNKKYKRRIKLLESLPICFTVETGIDPQIFWNYFKIPVLEKAKELYKKLVDMEYVFIHNSSSEGIVFEESIILDKLQLDKEKIIFINPCFNHYPEHHKFYEVAQNFVMQPLLYYIIVIENANYNVLSDSSFFCLAINLEIIYDNNYYFARGSRTYDVLYSDEYKFKDVKRQVFKNLKTI